MLAAQGGVCMICDQPETRVTRGTLDTLSVDHDHRTNVVRGLLCARCNKALGLFYDDVDLMATAVSYLAESNEEVRRVALGLLQDIEVV
jgi:hypothetical protein